MRAVGEKLFLGADGGSHQYFRSRVDEKFYAISIFGTGGFFAEVSCRKQTQLHKKFYDANRKVFFNWPKNSVALALLHGDPARFRQQYREGSYFSFPPASRFCAASLGNCLARVPRARKPSENLHHYRKEILELFAGLASSRFANRLPRI